MLFEGRRLLCLAGVQIAVLLGYEGLFDVAHWLVYIACAFYNALFVMILVTALGYTAHMPFGRTVLVLAVALCIASSVAIVWGIGRPFLSSGRGSFAVQVATAICAAGLLLPRLDKGVPAPVGPTLRDARPPVTNPLPLRLPIRMVIHIGCYFVVFGLMHSISSEVVSTFQTKLLSSYLGLAVAAVVFWALFVPASDLIWPRVRGAVFPLAMLGFILLPSKLSGSHAFSIFLAECASYVYFLVAILAAIKAAHRNIAPVWWAASLVCAWGGVFYAVGICCGAAFRGMRTFNATTYSVLTACVFVLLTVGTFWVGGDKTIGMFWGMEEKLSPKAHNEQQTRLKCEAIARSNGLTRRELEVLLPLVLGKSPELIGRDQTISIATVRSHIHNIYVKLDVHTHAELLERVERAGISDCRPVRHRARDASSSR